MHYIFDTFDTMGTNCAGFFLFPLTTLTFSHALDKNKYFAASKTSVAQRDLAKLEISISEIQALERL